MDNRIVMMKLQDNVAIALEPISAGCTVEVKCEGESFQVLVVDDIEFGHKFAMRDIAHGEDVLKYGEIIGQASRPIRKGEHVHIHNVEGKRGRGDKIGTIG